MPKADEAQSCKKTVNNNTCKRYLNEKLILYIVPVKENVFQTTQMEIQHKKPPLLI